jgi:type II secretory pathway pseudopilin PulG
MRLSVGRQLASEDGYSIVELVVVASLVIVVLSSALAVAEGFDSTVRRNQQLSESQQRTRAAVDQLARNLRNLASPTNELPDAVDKAEAYDLVFLTVGDSAGGGANQSNTRRVRYCLDAPQSGPARVWTQVQTWTTAAPPLPPSSLTCPSLDPGWTVSPAALAVGVTNRIGATERPLFCFNVGGCGPVGATDRRRISAITIQAWVRAADDLEPRLGVLRSQVFLRNQNEAPVASFDYHTTVPGHVILNGSASFDPEGDELTFKWYEGSSLLGTGAVLDASLAVGPHSITLKVYDPAQLEGTTTKPVTVL